MYRITGAEPEYIAQWVKRPAANQFFLAATTEGASQCRKNIDWDALYRQPIVLPSSDEQKKIAKLLMSLDFQIAFEKTEVRKLKDFKSAMLTKMFPKEDKTEPGLLMLGNSVRFLNWLRKPMVGERLQHPMKHSGTVIFRGYNLRISLTAS